MGKVTYLRFRQSAEEIIRLARDVERLAEKERNRRLRTALTVFGLTMLIAAGLLVLLVPFKL